MYALELSEDRKIIQQALPHVMALHPSKIIISPSLIANLAQIYQKNGQWQQESELRVIVLNARKRVLGEEHPDTMDGMNYLASACQVLGRLERGSGAGSESDGDEEASAWGGASAHTGRHG